MAEAYDPLDYDNLARSVSCMPSSTHPLTNCLRMTLFSARECMRSTTAAHFRSTLILLLKTCIPNLCWQSGSVRWEERQPKQDPSGDYRIVPAVGTARQIRRTDAQSSVVSQTKH